VEAAPPVSIMEEVRPPLPAKKIEPDGDGELPGGQSGIGGARTGSLMEGAAGSS